MKIDSKKNHITLLLLIIALVSFQSCNTDSEYEEDRKTEQRSIIKKKNKMHKAISLESGIIHNPYRPYSSNHNNLFSELYTFQIKDTIQKYENTVFSTEVEIIDIDMINNNYIVYASSYRARLQVSTSKSMVNKIVKIQNEKSSNEFLLYFKINNVKKIEKFLPVLYDSDVVDNQIQSYDIYIDDYHRFLFECSLVDYIPN